MPDMSYWLDRKYSNLEQGTANQGVEQAARANQANAVATMGIPAEAERSRALAEQAQAEAKIGIPSMAGLRNRQSTALDYSNRVSQFMDKYGLAPAEETARNNPGAVQELLFGVGRRLRDGSAKVMKKGETRVTDETGRGHPRVDTVPAMLAEGEAVLNAGAAERLGRDEIRALNKQGLRDMKMGEMAPTMKKGGRIGPFSGVSREYAVGTNFARTSPNNDAEYHPREYREPRDPEHDAEHMAQPLSAGGQGYGLRCGSAMVKKYADGTSDAGGHGSPDSPGAVNNAGTPGGRGRNIGAKFVGVRGYAAGIDRVPAESESELANFARQRARNQLDEATPAGTPVAHEAAGQQGAVTPSRDTARLRQMFGLQAQGFANGTADVMAVQPPQDPDTVYAAEGDSFIARAKDLASRAAGGLRGMMPQAGPVDLGTVGAAPTSAAEAATAAKVAPAAVGPGSTIYTNTAGQAFSDPNMSRYIDAAKQAQAAAQASTAAAAEEAALTGSRAYRTGQALASGLRSIPGSSLVRGAAPVLAGNEVFQNLGSYKFQEPGLDTSVGGVADALSRGEFKQTAKNIGKGLQEAAMDVVRGGAGLGDYLLPGQPLTQAYDRAVKERFGAGVQTPADREAAQRLAVNTSMLENEARKSYHDTSLPARAPSGAAAAPEKPQLSLRGLAMLGTMMGHEGAARALQSLDAEDKARISARASAASSANSWLEGVGKGLFMTKDDKNRDIEDQATLSQFRNFVNDRLSERGVNVQASTPEQRAALERQLVNDFKDAQVIEKQMQAHGRGSINKMFGGVEPRGRLTPVSRGENLSIAGSLSQPYSIGSSLNPLQKGVRVVDSMGNSFLVPESEYTKDPVTGLTDPVRELQLKSLRLR